MEEVVENPRSRFLPKELSKHVAEVDRTLPKKVWDFTGIPKSRDVQDIFGLSIYDKL